MRVDIKKITNIINKISDITSGDKLIPGVLLNLSNDDGGKLQVCYTDGHKALTEEIDVTVEEGDNIGGIIVTYEQFLRAVNNCQPSGKIKVDEMVIKYLDNQIIRISADQTYEVVTEDGSSQSRKMATKKMDIAWTVPGSELKSSILLRTKYNEIFEDDGQSDEYDKDELIDALTKTSAEKGRQIYLSSNTQTAFVANQAHATVVPISKAKELTEEEKNIIVADLTAAGQYTPENFDKRVSDEEIRIHQSVMLTQQMAKSLVSILGKTDADKVYVFRREKLCNIYINSDTEKVGVMFEMPAASKAHLGAIERYNSLGYKSCQLLFVKEFLDNNIKSAITAAKTDKVQLRFENTELEGAATPFDLIIPCGNSSASVADTYRVNPDDIIDPSGNTLGRTFNISLKVLSDMMAQLKTELIAMDANVTEDGTVCLRVSEIDKDKYSEEYVRIRQNLAQTVAGFDINSTPTPVENKLLIREATGVMKTKQYTMLAK